MRSRSTVACVLAFAACVCRAQALPGQTFHEFRAWASQKVLLAGIAQHPDEMTGEPAFSVDTSDHGIAWIFYASTDGTHVRRESLAVGNPGKAVGSATIRHDGTGYGFAFFASLYGQAIAHDFRASKQVAEIRDPADGVVMRYYLGSRYGYIARGGIVVETPKAFQVDLTQARRCARSPQDCSE
jgi:hypothetical protein